MKGRGGARGFSGRGIRWDIQEDMVRVDTRNYGWGDKVKIVIVEWVREEHIDVLSRWGSFDIAWWLSKITYRHHFYWGRRSDPQERRKYYQEFEFCNSQPLIYEIAVSLINLKCTFPNMGGGSISLFEALQVWEGMWADWGFWWRLSSWPSRQCLSGYHSDGLRFLFG